MTLAEVARLGEALALAEAQGVNPAVTSAIRLLLTTGCRKGEIFALRWKRVEWERGCLRLPDSKTGAKVVPLGAAALEALASLSRRADDSPFVLPSSRGVGHLVGLQKAWAKIRAAAELAGVRLHDCRHSFASVAVADGAALFTVAKVLGHKQARTTEIYAHLGDRLPNFMDSPRVWLDTEHTRHRISRVQGARRTVRSPALRRSCFPRSGTVSSPGS